MRRNLGYVLSLVADVGQRGVTLLMTDDVLDRVGAELDAADLWHQFDKAIWTFSAGGLERPSLLSRHNEHSGGA